MISSLLLASVLLPASSSWVARHRLVSLRRVNSPTDRAEEPKGTLLPAVAGVAIALLAASTGTVLGAALSVPSGLAMFQISRWFLSRVSRPSPDPLGLAGGWDLLAACLRAGLPVASAVRATVPHVPDSAACDLRKIADRLALGADPREAWRIAESSEVYVLARAAQRSAQSGASLAKVAEAAASELRARALDAAAARGQRAGVLITGPLGLSFLPAFLVLGVVPVVVGLASELARQW
jgi:Flp pilus assembly protein TadB